MRKSAIEAWMKANDIFFKIKDCHIHMRMKYSDILARMDNNDEDRLMRSSDIHMRKRLRCILV